MESMGVASGCGYIDFLILLIPTPLVSVLFCSSIPTFCSFFKYFSFLYITCCATDHFLYCHACLNFPCMAFNYSGTTIIQPPN